VVVSDKAAIIYDMEAVAREEIRQTFSVISIVFGTFLGVILANSMPDRKFDLLEYGLLTLRMIGIATTIFIGSELAERIAMGNTNALITPITYLWIFAVVLVPIGSTTLFINVGLWYATIAAWSLSVGSFAFVIGFALKKKKAKYD
jgi:hypothetical protein